MLDKVRQSLFFPFKPGLQPGDWAKDRTCRCTYTMCADANETNKCKKYYANPRLGGITNDNKKANGKDRKVRQSHSRPRAP